MIDTIIADNDQLYAQLEPRSTYKPDPKSAHKARMAPSKESRGGVMNL